MLIVSQDKKHIVNFENIKEIKIAYAMSIRVNVFRDCELILGFYQTEERTKEVFKQIIESYKDYRTAECDGYTDVLQKTAVYEMPEE